MQTQTPICDTQFLPPTVTHLSDGGNSPDLSTESGELHELSRRGIGLKAGHIITPGSINVPEPLPKGGAAVAVFKDLGQITITLAAA